MNNPLAGLVATLAVTFGVGATSRFVIMRGPNLVLFLALLLLARTSASLAPGAMQ